jgi:uncharacterized protein
MKVLFVTDLHGSTLVFEKAMRAAVDFDVDVLIVGGDVSGKRLIPVVAGEDGICRIYEPFKQKDDTGKDTESPSEVAVPKAELGKYLKRLEAKGYYWQLAREDEITRLNDDTGELRKLFDLKIYERLCEWADLATKRLPDGVQCVWTGGNDDDEAVLGRLAATDLQRFAYAEDRVTEIDGYEIASLGYSNRTPFNTCREMDEHDLLKQLVSLAEKAKVTEKLLLNVHVPPINCGNLDLCLSMESPSRLVHVGSTAVRSFIEDFQPLADFAGHIHEGKGTAKIGRTQIFNPGSDYSTGILQAFVVAISGSQIVDYVHFSR